MTSASYVPDRAKDRFHHEIVLYRGLDDLVETVVPYVREGLDLGERVMAAMPPDRIHALKDALGVDAAKVMFTDIVEIGANPARLIPEWRRFVEEACDRPTRGVGEPLWAGRRDVEIEECALHESLLNLAFEGGPAWQLMCPYGVEALPPGVVDEALRQHPDVGTGAGRRFGYQGSDYAYSAFSEPLPDPPANADVLQFGLHGLIGVRDMVRSLSLRSGVGVDAAEDLVLAAHELATNSVHHGGGVGVIGMWSDADAFVVEVRDPGLITDPLVGRELSPSLSESGRGVWMANQLCDLVQVRSAGTGTVVRLYAWLS